jgi:hypothetical protein
MSLDVPYRPSATVRRLVSMFPLLGWVIWGDAAFSSETPYLAIPIWGALGSVLIFAGYIEQYEFDDTFFRRRVFPCRWRTYEYAQITNLSDRGSSVSLRFKDGRSLEVPRHLADPLRVKQIIARRVPPHVLTPPGPRGPWNPRRPSERWRRFRRWLYS